MTQQWSDELQGITRTTLADMPMASFVREEGCRVKHLDGRYGAIRLEDAIEGNYTIHVDSDNKSEKEYPEKFAAIDDLITAGWAVD